MTPKTQGGIKGVCVCMSSYTMSTYPIASGIAQGHQTTQMLVMCETNQLKNIEEVQVRHHVSNFQSRGRLDIISIHSDKPGCVENPPPIAGFPAENSHY